VKRKSLNDPTGAYPLGRRAFEHQLALVSRRLALENTAELKEASQAISRARHWVEAGDYFAALRAISGIEVRLLAPGPGGEDRPLAGGDVEQALADLRRGIQGVGDVRGATEAAALWAAARQEVIRGSWESAMAIIGEAHAWLVNAR
jgi:hypothetical protein